MLKDLPIDGAVSILTDIICSHPEFINIIEKYEPNFLKHGTLFRYKMNNNNFDVAVIETIFDNNTYNALHVKPFEMLELDNSKKFDEFESIEDHIHRTYNYDEDRSFRIDKNSIEVISPKVYIYEVNPFFENGKLKKHKSICWSFSGDYDENSEMSYYCGYGENGTLAKFIRKKEVPYVCNIQ